MKKRFTREELEDRIYSTFFATIPSQDDEYGILHRAANRVKNVGTSVGNFFTPGGETALRDNESDERRNRKKAEGQAKAFDNAAIRINKNDPASQKQRIYEASMFGKRNAEIDENVKKYKRQGSLIGVTGGGVAGAAIGAGIGHLAANAANKKYAERIKELRAKDNLTEENLVEIRQLQEKMAKISKNYKRVGAITAGLAGAVGGGMIGQKHYKKNQAAKEQLERKANKEAFESNWRKQGRK